MKLFERLRGWRRPRAPELIVMRLADMHMVHPDQIVARCMSCHHEVGIYPSGQRVIAEHPGTIITCQICKQPGPHSQLAPGARIEPFQSRRKP
jgi:hypothetical protein